MQRVRIGAANEVILPDEVLRELEIAPGDEVEFARTNGTMVFRKAEDAVDRASRLGLSGRKPLTNEEIAEPFGELDPETAAGQAALRSARMDDALKTLARMRQLALGERPPLTNEEIDAAIREAREAQEAYASADDERIKQGRA